MRWLKIVSLVLLGILIGGLSAGTIVFEYMLHFGIDWNRWATSMHDEEMAGDALGRVAALTKLQAGDMNGARAILEWRLIADIPNLANMKKFDPDPSGSTTKAILAIKAYKQAHPWSTGNQELDKSTADLLNNPAHPSSSNH